MKGNETAKGHKQRTTKRKVGHNSLSPKQRAARSGNGKVGHVLLSLADIYPSPENDRLYRPVDPSDPAIIALAASIREHGLMEPIVVTLDGFILSGHRRYAAARLAGLTTIPCRVVNVRRSDDIDKFVLLLREYNRQREKTNAERMREEIVNVDPEEAYQTLIAARKYAAAIDRTAAMPIDGHKRRRRITAAKRPFIEAIQRVLEDRQTFWPLSDRQIHYALLNDPPLTHAAKPASRYANTQKSYKALVELLTRARLAGVIPMDAIADETRPVSVWDVHQGTASFVRGELDNLLKGYWRDLMQSQPNHIEIIGEKNTIGSILRPVASEYCIPLTIGRGYCSLPPRAAIAERYRKSGKTKLILLMVSDFDPDGEEIAQSLARSLRDDFRIADVFPVKVALTAEQVAEHDLPPILKAKASSSQYRKFTDRHGDNVFELEALPPEVLQTILRGAIDNIIDVAAFNRELAADRADATFLSGVRRRVVAALGELTDQADDSATS